MMFHSWIYIESTNVRTWYRMQYFGGNRLYIYERVSLSYFILYSVWNKITLRKCIKVLWVIYFFSVGVPYANVIAKAIVSDLLLWCNLDWFVAQCLLAISSLFDAEVYHTKRYAWMIYSKTYFEMPVWFIYGAYYLHFFSVLNNLI